MKSVSREMNSISQEIKTIYGFFKKISCEMKIISREMNSISYEMKMKNGFLEIISQEMKTVSWEIFFISSMFFREIDMETVHSDVLNI
jgi:hypothetical protein